MLIEVIDWHDDYEAMMRRYSEKKDCSASERSSAAQSGSRRQHSSITQHNDNRAATVAQRALVSGINDSPQAKACEDVQAMANLYEDQQKSEYLVPKAGPALPDVLQMKKTENPGYEELKRPKLRMAAGGLVGGQGTEIEKSDVIWAHLNEVYATTLGKGAGYWNQLDARVAAFQQNDEELMQQLADIRADYDRRYQAWYLTRSGGGQQTRTFGRAEIGVAPDETVGQYDNTIDTTEGSISADWNYANRDPARISDVDHRDEEDYVTRGLPNSEILWRQYFEASKQRFWVFKERRAKAAMSELNTLKRHGVQNSVSLQAGYMALPDGVTYQTAHTWLPGSDEFNAVLGTPNCSAAAFMLGDHVDETGGKSIRHIRATGEADASFNDVNFEIEFAVPEVEEGGDAELELGAAQEAVDEVQANEFD